MLSVEDVISVATCNLSAYGRLGHLVSRFRQSTLDNLYAQIADLEEVRAQVYARYYPFEQPRSEQPHFSGSGVLTHRLMRGCLCIVFRREGAGHLTPMSSSGFRRRTKGPAKISCQALFEHHHHLAQLVQKPLIMDSMFITEFWRATLDFAWRV